MLIMGTDPILKHKIIYNNLSTDNSLIVDKFWSDWYNFNDRIGQSINVKIPLFETMFRYVFIKIYTTKFYQTLYEIMLFNSNITNDSFANLIWNIASNKDVKERIFEECSLIDVNDFDQVNNLEYLELVINELAKLNPGIAMTFAETITEPIVCNNFILPKGTLISS